VDVVNFEKMTLMRDDIRRMKYYHTPHKRERRERRERGGVSEIKVERKFLCVRVRVLIIDVMY
jgi:hypothetical protein